MFELPVFVSVTLCELVPLRGTFPKAKLAGVGVSTRAVDMPVPLSGIDRGELDASLVRLILPLIFPVEVGPKTALNVVLAPAVMVVGTVRPEILNATPDTTAWVSVSDELP